MDIWLDPKPLYESRLSPIDEEVLELKVVDYWEQRRGWKWEQLSHVLPASKLLQIVATIINVGTKAKDRMGWLDARGGKFTVKSAYMLACEEECDNIWHGWKLIWKARVQQRMRIFIWIMAHRKLLTNEEENES